MQSPYSFCEKLTPSHRHHDLKPVPIGQNLLVELATRNNFAVALNSDTLAQQRHVFQQLRDIQSRVILIAL